MAQSMLYSISFICNTHTLYICLIYFDCNVIYYSIRENRKKKTLSYIMKVKWNEDTHEKKGKEREAFFDLCLKEFKVVFTLYVSNN